MFANLCDDGNLLNLAIIYTDSEQDNLEWAHGATQDDVVRELLYRWKIFALPELPTWIRGRTALIGDAPHATFPSPGQGAAMAIEEAVTLGCLLPLGTPVSEIPARMNAYQAPLQTTGRVYEQGVCAANDRPRKARGIFQIT
ncbi:hypothetical protein C8R43DRAFT_401383 [Mycena crocata]|nr:hypothetical protein C8R43DRAFT_401383 [Mycena crocata]